ncbi:MAG: cysteine--tRNA ligase [Candidatus Buchananbacteria bacterium RIFCSPHIGHO2_02_FULL_38_8]|uniref:Cysteine--tRNA ligase n=2 Tax=Candidatus Buchananiibacteriota TaxID=1817903 RepID=A0A1G1XZZ7_9BACT|nr:MAG: cysteine--tRNA ligase [Candidatus Buchananbacteria bacterium RIFCSPHIGHO2_01_FULL_39_8]OGY47250.1 MAG: cysteine--tRNA ligase [Candidatus Buchananbacteria bacterium RIFCSPHIGHO2_02_FULL_38_8]
MAKIFLYNTLTHQKEEFKPIKKGRVGLYTCGPTVYDYAHIGNLRTYIFEDILKRVFLYNDYKEKHIENITDVGHLVSDADEGEDKMMKALRREGLEPSERSLLKLADKYTEAFKRDIKLLNILEPDKWTKATDHVKEMIELIKKIDKNGYTYETDDGVYFDTTKFKNYGELAALCNIELKAGIRVEMGSKKSLSDFALWIKAVGENKNHVMQWNSPWGKGFPGWHIECSAMSMKYLGEHFDIHCGGIDHIPVHHTNEIAQNEGATSKKSVNYWVHGEFLILDKGKMAKSAGTFITLQILIDEGFDPLAYRYLNLQTHYRQKLTFSFESLQSAQNALQNLWDIVADYDKPRIGCAEYEEKFLKAINDDLNMPKALAVVWDLIKDSELPTSAKKQTLLKFDWVLGLGLKEAKKEKIPLEITKLANQRQEARKNKDWQKADQIRQEIENKGYEIKDEQERFIIKKKK